MTDYISREAAIKIIEEKQRELCPLGMFSRHAVYGSDREKFDAWEEIIEQMEQIPAADVRENKPGKWERTSYKSGYGYRCSECGAIYNKRKSRLNYCPNCGADMRFSSTNYTNPATAGENREVSDVRAWLNNGADMRGEADGT